MKNEKWVREKVMLIVQHKKTIFIFKYDVIRTVSYFLAVTLMCFPLTGCYTYSQGELVETSKIPGTSVLEDYSYRTLIESRPTINRPSISIQLVRIPRYEVQIVNVYAEEKKPDYTVGWIATIIGSGILYGASQVGDSSKSNSEELAGGLAIAGWSLFLPGLFTISKSSTPVKTGKTIEGRKEMTYEEGVQISLDETRISASFGTDSKNYMLDRMGRIEINLVSDFDLRTFESPEKIKISIKSIDPSINCELTLDSTEWTVPHIRILATKGWLFEEPSATSRRIIEYQLSDIFRILDTKDTYWWKVEMDGVIGWIPSQAGAKYWSVLN